MKYVLLDGRAYSLKQIREAYKAQRQAAKREEQTLFPLREDVRPESQRNASGRYAEPTLFDVPAPPK